MEMEFVRHEPCYDRILLVLSLDRQKKKERILIGGELQIRFRLRGNTDTDVLCDATRPLGTFLAEFEHDPDGEWSRLGLMPLREALHSNRWKQPALEQSAGEFLSKKYLTGDPVRMYAACWLWFPRQGRSGRYGAQRRRLPRQLSILLFLLRAAVHGEPFRLCQWDIVLKYRVCVRLYIVGGSPTCETVLNAFAVFLRVLAF